MNGSRSLLERGCGIGVCAGVVVVEVLMDCSQRQLEFAVCTVRQSLRTSINPPGTFTNAASDITCLRQFPLVPFSSIDII